MKKRTIGHAAGLLSALALMCASLMLASCDYWDEEWYKSDCAICDHYKGNSGDGGSSDSSGTGSGTSSTTASPSLTFRTGKSEVVAGDIAVKSGSTVKYVPADKWDAAAYSVYTLLGVCVNSSFMINLTLEAMIWPDAMSSYPGSGEWRLPTRAELQAIYNAKATLNASLPKISGSQLLYDRFYWSSESFSIAGFAYAADLTDGYDQHFNGDVNHLYVRPVRLLS